MVDRTMIGFAVRKGYISARDEIKALEYMNKNGCSEYRALSDTLNLEEKTLLEIYAAWCGVKYIADADDIEINDEIIGRCDRKVLAAHKMIPLEISENGKMQVLVTSVKNTLRIEDYLRTVFPCVRYEYILISEKNYGLLMSSGGGGLRDFADMTLDTAETDSNAYELSGESESDIVSFVNSVFSDAIKKRASDIHIEPQEKYVRIRYRIDGSLVEMLKFKSSMASQVINRIKTMADMDVNSSFEPQDGNIKAVLDNMPLDMRASVLPSEYGESVVLRILNKSAFVYNLDAIGLSEQNREIFERLIRHENGIILCTGPTGSGKSTTLYCVVSALNRPDIKIMTAEDPVEIHIDGIIQSAVNQRLSFDDTLKAQLRQDPNILLLGEIRDGETANTAITASNTGHLVLSTLHANSALASISRLRSKSMGIDSYNLGDTLRGIINQRLVRRLCDKCKEAYTDPSISDKTIYKKHDGGCKHCGGLGYRGRVGLHEILEITPEIGDLIIEDHSIREIRTEAEKGHLRTLSDDALDKVKMGLTSVEEVKGYLNVKGRK